MTIIFRSSIRAMLLANTYTLTRLDCLQYNKHICTEYLIITKFSKDGLSLKINIQLESRIADMKTNPPKLSDTLCW
jgi:hypothetical protein